jgi:hypothetical protein
MSPLVVSDATSERLSPIADADLGKSYLGPSSASAFLSNFELRISNFSYKTALSPSRARPRRGLTLVEMLVSLVCVILLMLAYTQLFSSVGTHISDARSMIDLTNRMRSAADRLRTDLAGHTCDLIPWQKPESGAGYFEYIEGPLHDAPGQNGIVDTVTQAGPNFLGDTDDVLMFTVRSKDVPFTGLYNGTTVQSQVAEVVWFLRPTMIVDPSSSSAAATVQVSPPTFTLYRHTYLVLPTYQGSKTTLTGAAPTSTAGLLLPVTNFYQNNDISAHIEVSNGTAVAVANTLGDTTKRECRFGHAFINNTGLSNGFPHRVYPAYLVPFGGNLSGGNYSIFASNSRYGEDVVLTNVVGFDVQAWDPTAPTYINSAASSQMSVAPADPGFSATPTILTSSPSSPPLYIYPTPASVGAFVDLNWTGTKNVYSPYFAISQTNVSNVGPCGKGTATDPLYVYNGSIPLMALQDCTILNMSPIYSTGYPKSKLVAAAPSTGPASPISFTKDWLFDDQTDANGLPNYQYFGYVPATYDTWSTHYEHDGLDQDNNGVIDQAASGFEDNANNTETSPPYPVPLRGIKITLRCYEPDSRQFHEVSVVESFVPE